jgi:hypothetical protein
MSRTGFSERYGPNRCLRHPPIKLFCPPTSPRLAGSLSDRYAVPPAARDSALPKVLKDYFIQEVFFGMPRFYFHVKRGQVTVLDQQGSEFADLSEAVEEAEGRAKMIAANDVLQGISANGRKIIIADDAWRPVVELPF